MCLKFGGGADIDLADNTQESDRFLKSGSNFVEVPIKFL